MTPATLAAWIAALDALAAEIEAALPDAVGDTLLLGALEMARRAVDDAARHLHTADLRVLAGSVERSE